MVNAAVDSGVDFSTTTVNGVIKTAGNLAGEVKNSTDDTLSAVKDARVLLNNESGLFDKIKAGADLGQRAVNGVTRGARLTKQALNTVALPFQLPNILGATVNGAVQGFSA